MSVYCSINDIAYHCFSSCDVYCFSAEFIYYVSCTLVFSYGEFFSVICQIIGLRTKWIGALWGPEEAQLVGCAPGSCCWYSYFFQDNGGSQDEECHHRGWPSLQRPLIASPHHPRPVHHRRLTYTGIWFWRSSVKAVNIKKMLLLFTMASTLQLITLRPYRMVSPFSFCNAHFVNPSFKLHWGWCLLLDTYCILLLHKRL